MHIKSSDGRKGHILEGFRQSSWSKQPLRWVLKKSRGEREKRSHENKRKRENRGVMETTR